MAFKSFFFSVFLLHASFAWAVNPGEILVADFPAAPNPSSIVRFNAAGNPIGVFLDATDGIIAPRDIAFNASGDLYVADNAAVLIFGGTGASLGSITSGITKAIAITFDSSGNLYVSNRVGTGPHEIIQYSSAGAHLQTWIIPEFDNGSAKPFAREMLFDAGGLLYLALRGSNSSSNDNLVATLNVSIGVFTEFADSADQVTAPIGLAFESSGSLLVTNDTGTQQAKSSRIIRLNSSGTFVNEFWNTGAARDLVFDGFGQLHSPNRIGGVFLWNPGGTLKKEYGTASLLEPISVALIPASAPFCQNEIVESGESCDDGNATPCDGCSAACVVEFGCGDGSTCGAEECDDANAVTCDGCSNSCTLEVCGDGVLCASLGEACDDSNTAPCDGCSPICTVESCGNGIADCNEECDDANAIACDGCTGCSIDELAYQDTFENGTNGWSMTGLWNQDDFRSVSPTHAWYYGQTTFRSYQTIFPGTNAGELTSPTINLTDVSGASLTFSYFLETEDNPGVDVTSIEVSRDNFVADITVLESPLPEAASFIDRVFSLSAFDGDLIKLRFTFDTVDDNANHLEGFYVDDVAVRGTGAPVCGNGLAANACGEGCDDGNTSGGDGCSALCQAEGVTGQVTFSGIGQGGSIEITISGVALSVTTFAGDSSITVASRIADAINNDLTLQGMGVSATYSVSRVDVIAGTVDTATSTDPGIQLSGGTIPALSLPGVVLLALLLAAILLHRLRRSSLRG